MKKFVKIALIAVAVVVVLVVAVLALTLLNLDSIVKKGVEQGGSYALKVPVTLSSAKISIFKGRASLQGFSVANPAGYSTNPALGFGEITAEIKPSTINKNPVEIPEIVVRRPEFSIEGDLGGDTNLARLQKNLEETLGTSGGKAGAPAGKPAEKTAEKPAEKAAEAGPAKRLKLDHILLENPKVTLAAKLLGHTQQKTIELGKLEIKDLAKEFPEGMTPAELGKRVLDEVIRAALKDRGEVGQALQKLADKGVLGTVKSVTDDATKLGTDIINDPTKATDPKKALDSLQDVKDVKDLFKKKK